MYETALSVTENILANIKEYGYMPNGARVYYLVRSQPPVATLIVKSVLDALLASAASDDDLEDNDLKKKNTHKDLNHEMNQDPNPDSQK